MKIISIDPPGNEQNYSLAIHGGAGARPALLTEEEKAIHHEALKVALHVGMAILERGGSALDAVCESVIALEDSPLFNAAHGAALTRERTAELDAAVMTGDGDAGAVAAVRFARNPVLAARAVMENSPHVLLVDPPVAQLEAWSLDVVERDYFLTEKRLAQVEALQAQNLVGPRHGTVGAVARDSNGNLASATSTGGTANQEVGRVGDTPVIGAGTFADSSTVAISCTGEGEHFLRQVTAHELHARIKYLAEPTATASRKVLDDLGEAGGRGGLIAVDSEGRTLLGYNSEGMFSGYVENGKAVSHV